MERYYTVTMGTETISYRTREAAKHAIENQQKWELDQKGHAKHYAIVEVVDPKADSNPFRG